MTQIDRTTTKPLYTRQTDQGFLEVYQDGGAFLGYCNGEVSITATSADIALRGLIKKHVQGLESAQVIDFAAKRRERFGLK